MRLYKQELKRLVLTTRTIIIFVIAITLSAALAFLASEFCDANYNDEEGNLIQLHGIDAIEFIEETSSAGNGEVTADRLRDALQTYQELYSDYGTDPLGDGFPLDVYWEQVDPIRPLLAIMKEAYGTNEKPADLMTLEPSELDGFYEACKSRLTDAMNSDDELKDASIIGKAASMYDGVKKPFIISRGYTRDALDYIEIAVLLLVLLSAIMAAPVFSERYESGEDSVIRCTEFGQGKLVRTTLLAVVTVSSAMYLTGMGVHLLISDIIFGFDSLKESIQILYSVYSLPSLDLLGLQIVLLLSGWICCIAVTVMALCISSIVRGASTAVVLSVVLVFLPTVIYSGLGAGSSWLLPLIPSSAVGLSNNMLYSLVDLRFLSACGKVFWYPAVLVIADIIETVILGFITHFAYTRHQVR
ncbi:MAG: hypothetical protein ACSW8G_04080 [Bacillota bacterium]